MDQVRIVTDEESPAEEVAAEAVMDEVAAAAGAEDVEVPAEEMVAAAETEAVIDEVVAVVEAEDVEVPAEEMAAAAETEAVMDEGVAVVEAEEVEVPAEEMAAAAETEAVKDEVVAIADAEEAEAPISEAAAEAEEPVGSAEEPLAPDLLLTAGKTEQDLVETSEMGELPVEDWDYQRPKRGQVRTGVILAIRDQEIIVDVGVKRDGLVPFADMQRMGPEALEALSVGDEVPVYILRPEDQDGNLLVSLFMARQTQAWTRAEELAKSGKVWEESVVGYNKGGVVVPVDEIRGFVPASQLPGFPSGLSQEDRLEKLSTYVGETLRVKVIEINSRKRRLILSARSAHRQWRKQQRQKLLEDLREGEVRTGTVSSLANFGAFIDLGGADGLVHLSELSWQRVRHPKEVLKVGDKVEAYVLRLDREKNRIGLSLKRLQPEPWALVEDKYELGQLIEGVVTNVVDFGAFAEIEEGVEGLIHASELTDTKISHPRDVVKKGDLLLLRIIRIDARRKRLGLSLKRVLESEWAEWAAQVALAEAQKDVTAVSSEEAVEAAIEEAPALSDEKAELAEGESAAEPMVEEEGAPVAEEETPAPSDEGAQSAETEEEAALEPVAADDADLVAEEEAGPVEEEAALQPVVADETAPGVAGELPEESAPEEEALPEPEPVTAVEESASVPEAPVQASEEPATEEGEESVELDPARQEDGEDSSSGEADASVPLTEDSTAPETGEKTAALEAGIEDLSVDSTESIAVDA